MTNPTLEQVEAARAEYDRSEDMCAALVAAAGAAPKEQNDKPADLSVMNGWLVESGGKHTCGAGIDGYGHEPGCGYVPVLNLAELDGYPAQVDGAKLPAVTRVTLAGRTGARECLTGVW